MPADLRRVKDVFAAAAELADPADRQALLDRECGENAELRRRVDMLLAAHDRSDAVVDHPLAFGTIDDPSDTPGIVVAGRYKLLEEIGEGGMGSVWMAEQREPVKRLVALKLIKPGMDSRAVLARFEAERQALALMDHPNIAKVLDGGTTEQGRPYFVMELVKGLPLTEYCDDRRMNVRDRLDLFVQVCSAVQHAHQKGIIHRDLKPSNVLVTEHDGTPVPKVIDFGLAKALHGPQTLTEKTLHTSFGAVVGTPLYMAPEQVGINALDVDTRTDIYALGVILYELLTGTTPLEKKRVAAAAWDEMLRIIREEDPPRPSLRLSTSGALPSLAATRQTEPAKLSRLVRGELDLIVMKALEKDRNRRYETANGLAMDLRRHLAGDPVQAVPPSAGYRLRKFARRHRGPVTAVLAVFLVLVGGVVGTTWSLLQAQAARDAEAQQRAIAEARETEARAAAEQERQSRDREAVQRQRAEENETNAVREKQVADAVRWFLQHDLLLQADPRWQADTLRRLGEDFKATANPTVKELLDRAAAGLTPAGIEAKFPRQRAVQASILETVGIAYQGIGEYEKSIEFLTRAVDNYCAVFGTDHPNSLGSLNNLAVGYLRAGNLPRAIALFKQTLEVRQKISPSYDRAALSNLHNLAEAYLRAGKLPEAIKLHEQARDGRLKLLGPEHPSTLLSLKKLAMAYLDDGRVTQAVALMENVRDLQVKTLGLDHPSTEVTLGDLGHAYMRTGKLPEAIELLEQVRNVQIKRFGLDHPITSNTLSNLSLAYWRAGKREQAISVGRQAVLGAEKGNFQLLHATATVSNLGNHLEELGQYAEAESWRRKLLAASRGRNGVAPDGRGRQLAELGLNLLTQKKWADAEPLLRECLMLREKVHPDRWLTFNTRSRLGSALLGQGKYAEAEPLLLAGYHGLKERWAQIPASGRPRLSEAVESLVELYTVLSKPDEAAKWRAERDDLLWALADTPPPATEAK
jgi:serine/threonine protein kinase/tetratricopeptide (TPR) repeat protein